MRRRRWRVGGLAWLNVITILAAASLSSEPVTIPNSEIRTLTSRANGVEYRIYVGLPNGYAEGGRRYGVVYLLDADYSFAIARNVVEHLADRDHLEPLIVVAVAYAGPNLYRLNRTRDYTPKFSPDGGYGPEMQKHSGGGPKFQRFLTEELVPYIDAQYRTIPGRRALTGHSYGGLFCAWTLMTTGSRVFDRYIIVSPSLWYDGYWMFKARHPLDDIRARVYLGVGAMEVSERGSMPADLRRFAALLRKEHPRTALRHETLAQETHNSVFPSAFSRGLRFVFEGR